MPLLGGLIQLNVKVQIRARRGNDPSKCNAFTKMRSFDENEKFRIRARRGNNNR